MSLFPLGLLSQGSGAGGGTPAYELISTTTLGSDTANVTLSSIPSTYKHLRFVISGRSSTASTGFSNVYAQINGSSSSSYWFSYLEVSGSSYSNQRSTTVQTSAKMGYTQNNNHTSGYFSGHELEIVDYTSTNKYKTARFQSRTDSIDTAQAYMSYGSFVFTATAAVSSITFFLSSGSWITGSRFSVYGITG
jgi:hypothetical protein